MKVLVAGSHGQVGQHITSLLASGAHSVRAMVRKQGQVPQLEALGAEVVVADLTQDVSDVVAGCDAIIFAAGSAGKNVKGVDRDGAIKLMDAAKAQGVKRYVMLSSVAAGEPERGPEALRDYLIAKGEADNALQASGLAYTVVRPGQLTNDEATNHIRVAARFDEPGDISRQDVAKTLVATLDEDATIGKTFEVLKGDTPVTAALAQA